MIWLFSGTWSSRNEGHFELLKTGGVAGDTRTRRAIIAGRQTPPEAHSDLSAPELRRKVFKWQARMQVACRSAIFGRSLNAKGFCGVGVTVVRVSSYG